MERTMPVDLENAQLTKTFRGYDCDEVDELIQKAARTMDILLAENESLREQMDRLRAENERYRLDDSTMKEALISAQKAAADTMAMAHKQAGLILEEARQSALAERVAVQQKVSELRWECEKLKQDKLRFVEEMKTILGRFSSQLDALPNPELAAIQVEALTVARD